MHFDFFLVAIIFVVGVHIGCILFLLLKSGGYSIKRRCLSLYQRLERREKPWEQLIIATVIGDIVVASVIACGLLIALVIFCSGTISAYLLGSAAPGLLGVISGLLVTPLVLRAASALK
jgi:hypothetical protein